MTDAMFCLNLKGRPASKKNEWTIIRVKGRPQIGLGTDYRRWEAGAVTQLRLLWRTAAPLPKPLTAKFEVRVHPMQRGDMYNYIESVCDALQKAGVIVNDRHIVHDGGSLMVQDRKNPGVTIWLWRPSEAGEEELGHWIEGKSR